MCVCVFVCACEYICVCEIHRYINRQRQIDTARARKKRREILHLHSNAGQIRLSIVLYSRIISFNSCERNIIMLYVYCFMYISLVTLCCACVETIIIKIIILVVVKVIIKVHFEGDRVTYRPRRTRLPPITQLEHQIYLNDPIKKKEAKGKAGICILMRRKLFIPETRKIVHDELKRVEEGCVGVGERERERERERMLS